MRRFIAYLLASITIFLGIGFSFKPIATSINADLSYRDGKEITFRLKERGEGEKTFEDVDSATKYYADIMEQRLISYGVADYKIVTSGVDTIKVTLTASNDTEYTNIGKLLAVNPRIELSNAPKEGASEEERVEEIHVDGSDGTFSWHSEKAYITYDGTATVLIMPIPAEARTQVEEMYNNAKKFEGEDPKPEQATRYGDDPAPEEKQSIFLWMNRNAEEDTYEKKDTDPNVKEKLIYDKFNTSNFYYGTNKDAFQIRFTPTGNDAASIRVAYNNALYYMNLLNASEVDFDCTVIRTEIIPASVENLLIYGEQVHIAMSATFIALIIAFIVISLLLSLFYRLGAVAIVTTSTLTTFLSFLFFVLFKAPFNVAALVGIIAIFLASIFTGVAYNNYLHEEVYKGRSLKKANFEASKKTTMLTVDVSVVAALLGILLYALGGRSVASVGVVLITGAVFNLLINTFILKGLMWLLTNNTSFQDKKAYKLLSIKADKVPDLSKEEKPNYFGPYINRDFTKKKKISGIVIGLVTLASVIGLITFAATSKNVFNTANYFATTNEISFSIKNDNQSIQPLTTEEIKAECLDQIKNNGQALKYDNNISYYVYTTHETVSSQIIDYYHHTYVINVLENNINSETYSFKDSTNLTLFDAVDEAMKTLPVTVEENSARVSTNEVYNVPSNVGLIFAASVISIAVTSLYFFIRRYRLSRVMTYFVSATVSSVITIGVIALTRITSTPVMAVSIALTTMFTTLMAMFIMHKDKDLIREERIRDLATRKSVLKKANAMALVPLISFAIIGLYLTINFFGFGNKAFVSLFFGALLGNVAAFAIMLTLFTPMCDFFDEKFSRIKLPEIKIRRKKKVKVKSNEPEEAIFIGIND